MSLFLTSDAFHAFILSQRLVISLSPPPDLVVSSITTARRFYTGDRIQVQFNVSNEGLGEPFHYWWRDLVVSRGYMKRNCILVRLVVFGRGNWEEGRGSCYSRVPAPRHHPLSLFFVIYLPQTPPVRERKVKVPNAL